MKCLTFFKLSCLSALLSTSIFAQTEPFTKQILEDAVAPVEACANFVEPGCGWYGGSHFGTSTFSVTDPNNWYEIETHSYPEMTPLSFGRNKGIAEGGVYLSPTGVTIGERGNYWVSITAVLQNPTPESTILIPVFLAIDDVYDDTEDSLIGGVVTLPSEGLGTIHSSGILRDVVPGTRLSLVATNAGYPVPVPVTGVSWTISLFKLP